MEAQGSSVCCPQTRLCSPDRGLVTLQYYRGGLVVGRSLVVLQCSCGGKERGREVF